MSQSGMRFLQAAFLLGLVVLLTATLVAYGSTSFSGIVALIGMILAVLNGLLGKPTTTPSDTDKAVTKLFRNALQTRTFTLPITIVVWALALTIAGSSLVRWHRTPPVVSLRVAYLEIEGLPVDFLARGRADPAIEKLFGGQPFIIRTSVYNRLVELSTKYTVPFRGHSGPDKFDWLTNKPVFVGAYGLSLVPRQSVNEQLDSYFGGEGGWYLPDPQIQLLRTATRALNKRVAQVSGSSPGEISLDFSDLKHDPSDPSIAFLREIIGSRLPPKLITAELSLKGCGDPPTWDIDIHAPDVLLVAMTLENISKEPISIGSFSVVQNDVEAMRPEREDELRLNNTPRTFKANLFPLRSLRPNERIMLPLKLILKKSSEPTSLEDVAFIEGYLSEIDTVEFPDLLDGMRRHHGLPAHASIKTGTLLRYARNSLIPQESVYVSGPSITIKSLEVDGVEFTPRLSDRNHIAFMGGLPFTSCPYVYVRRAATDSWSRQGHILWGRHDSFLKSTDELRLDFFNGTLLVREEEDETTFIDSIYVRQQNPDGTVRIYRPANEILRFDDNRYQTLNPNDSVRIDFPTFHPCPNCTYTAVATGYYIPLRGKPH